MDSYNNVEGQKFHDLMYPLPTNNNQIISTIKSVDISSEDAFIEKMDDFLDLISRQTDISPDNELILLLHEQQSNRWTILEELREVFICKYMWVATENFWTISFGTMGWKRQTWTPV